MEVAARDTRGWLNRGQLALRRSASYQHCTCTEVMQH